MGRMKVVDIALDFKDRKRRIFYFLMKELFILIFFE